MSTLKRLLSLILLVFIFGSFSLEVAAELKWAADAKSGLPFVFYPPENLTELRGFEVDLIKALEAELLEPMSFVQNQWDGLVGGLLAKNYDLVINGLEITPEREQEILFSDPYYVTSERLVVRRGDEQLRTLSQLEGKRVGTLDGSLAQRILEQYPKIEPVLYDDESLAYSDLKLKRTDAVLLDEPIAIYYAKGDPQLSLVGEPIGKVMYGIGIHPDSKPLREKINSALQSLRDKGKLKEILGQWGLWNRESAEHFKLPEDWSGVAVYWEKYAVQPNANERSAIEKLERYLQYLPLLLRGALTTVLISLGAMILAILIGLFLVALRVLGPRPLSLLSQVFIEVIRGSPLLIQLYLLYYGLPHLGLQLSPLTAAIWGLGINYGTCEAENYRAGLQSVSPTQRDAARALGFSRFQSLWHIELPQALRLVIPPMTNDFIALLKDSSLVSVITLVELATVYGQIASVNFDYLGLGILVALIYILLGLPFVQLAKRFERRHKVV